MPEAQMPRVDPESGSVGYPQEAPQGLTSDFYRIRAEAAESGRNRVGSLLEHSVYNDYGTGNPKITSDIASYTRIIREIATKNGTNSDGELLGLEELIKWANDSQEQKEKTIRAYSLYLYLEQEIAGIADELKEPKRDYIIFLQEKIAELSGVIGSSKHTKPTLLGKMLPTVRKYALAVTSVVALGSLGYAKHLKNVYEEKRENLVADFIESGSEHDKKESDLLHTLSLRDESLKSAQDKLQEKENLDDGKVRRAILYEGAAEILLYRLQEIDKYPDIKNLFYSYEDKIRYLTGYPYTTQIPLVMTMVDQTDQKTGKKIRSDSRRALEGFIRHVDGEFLKKYPNNKWKEKLDFIEL